MGNIKILFLAVVSIFMSCCSTEPENEYERYKIKIDEITMTISANDTLIIKFDGFVGPDGCHRFKEFVVIKENYNIGITVWGEKPNYETVCTQALVFLNGEEYRIHLNKSGTYNIIVHQPDDSVLKDSIYVN
ncbi:MAG: hypothetical protein OQJ81_01120 [Melioribacteraceae bacterium]|nr:hypothetical protein [Melioribacteraceae bacterium]